MKNKKLAIIFVFLATVLGSAAGVVVKISIQRIPPMTFTFIRFLLAILFVWPFFLKEKLSFRNIKEIIPLSILPALNILIFSFAIQSTSADVAQMIYATVPISVSIFSYFLIKEKLNFVKFLGIVLGFIGVIVMLSAKQIIGDYSLKTNLTGSSLIFIGSLIFSLYLVLSKPLQKKYSPLAISTIYYSTTMILAMFLSSAEFSNYHRLVGELSFHPVIGLLYVAAIGTSLYYYLQQTVIKYGSPLLSSVILYLQPVFTVFWAYIFLGEQITKNFIIAAVIVIIGAIMVSV